MAWVDISTGEFRVIPCPVGRLSPELARLAPREVVVSEAKEADLAGIVSESGAAMTPLSRGSFDSTGAEKRLCALYDVATLDAFGAFDRAEASAMGAIVEYLDLTQRGKLPLLRPPVKEAPGGSVQIDAATRRNLEITQALSGGREGSLIAAIDRTVTAAGARLLERRLSAPSRDLSEIHARLEAVRFLAGEARLAESLRADLRKAPDMDRALSRLALDRGGPRDLTAIRAGLAEAGRIAGRLSDEGPDRIARAAAGLLGFDDLVAFLNDALVAEPPLLVRDGGFIAPGHNTELDEARQLRDQGRGVIAKMQADYVAQTGIQSLKIKHNNVLGYFIETTATHTEKCCRRP